MLGQTCDGSITSPVIALFENFCNQRGLSSSELYQQAYPNEALSAENYKTIRKFALWQGVEFPSLWNQSAIVGLVESLGQINYHSLNDVLIEILSPSEQEAVFNFWFHD